MKEQREKLQSEFTVGSTVEQFRELNLLNYHIEVTENRMNYRFNDHRAEFEGELIKTNQVTKQHYQ